MQNIVSLTAVDWFIRSVLTVVITIAVAIRFSDTAAILTLELVSQACYTVIAKNIPSNQMSLFLLTVSVQHYYSEFKSSRRGFVCFLEKV